MAQVFFVYIVLSNQLGNDTLCDGACHFFVSGGAKIFYGVAVATTYYSE
jgi:hypothetical protein